MKKIILNLFILLLTFNMTLFANTASDIQNSVGSTVELSTVNQSAETVEVALDSFGTLGIIIMIALSSLLGAFFMKDELSEAFKE